MSCVTVELRRNRDESLTCAVNGEIIVGDDRVAMLVRRRPGGMYDAVCVLCAATIMQHALVDAIAQSITGAQNRSVSEN